MVSPQRQRWRRAPGHAGPSLPGRRPPTPAESARCCGLPLADRPAHPHDVGADTGQRPEVGRPDAAREGGEQTGPVGASDELRADVGRHMVEQPRPVLDRGVEHGRVGAGAPGDVGQRQRIDAADPVRVGIPGGDDERVRPVVLHRPDHPSHDLDGLLGRRAAVEADLDVGGPGDSRAERRLGHRAGLERYVPHGGGHRLVRRYRVPDLPDDPGEVRAERPLVGLLDVDDVEVLRRLRAVEGFLDAVRGDEKQQCGFLPPQARLPGGGRI